MGHVRGLEKYEWVTWKVKIRLSIVYGKRVWWLLGGGHGWWFFPEVVNIVVY